MVETIVLENGATVLLQEIPNANSVSIGYYALAGLLQEEKETNGIAHFLEHMSFKGTKRRSAKQITESVDRIGGSINAHTTKEYTCYYMTMLPHCWDKGLDILSDLYFHSTLGEAEMQLERQVVLEEINMYEDTPDDLIHDVYSSTIWENSKLGRPILGTSETLMGIDRKAIQAFKQHYLNPKNIVVSVAGKIDSKKVLGALKKVLKLATAETKPFSQFTANPTVHSKVNLMSKTTEQIHFCVGAEGLSITDEKRYSMTLLATILGGSMSSRLFQKIREKKGWAYSVYAYTSAYRHSGLFTIYGGINKDKFSQSLRIILKEFSALQDRHISKSELRKVKEQLKGNLVLSLERSGAWMGWNARSQIYHGRVLDVDEVLEKVEAVSLDDVQMMAQRLFSPEKMALAAIGPAFREEAGLGFEMFLAENKLAGILG